MGRRVMPRGVRPSRRRPTRKALRGAAAGDDEVGATGEGGALTEVGPDEAAVGVEDGLCREGGCGGDRVFWFRGGGLAGGQETGGEGFAVLLAAAGLWGRSGEKGVFQEF